jgi:hypothetical protein
MIVRFIMSAAAIVAVTSSLSTTATAAPFLDPNLAFCTAAEGGGSPWCGYHTLAQCQDSASGTGHECIPNFWINESDGSGLRLHSVPTDAQAEQWHGHRRR